jgi:hypothetical protein
MLIMKILIVAILVSSSVYASEREGMSACESYRQRADNIQKEISKISLELAESHAGPEAYSSPETHANNCEDVGRDHHSALISRRDTLNKDLEAARKEIKRACPYVYPE